MMFVAAAARPSRCHPLWLLGFVVLLPGTCSQCGSLPRLSHAIPSDPNRTEGFPVNTEVTYRCLNGFVKIPGKSDTVVCLSNSQWSNIEEFCGRSCLAPPRLKSAELSPEDLRKNYYPVGTTVSYVCRLAYESTGLRPVITCLENLTWAEAPEFCLGKSCGVPESPEHGRLVDATNNRFGAKVNIICDDGYKVSGRHFIQCLLNRDQVEWSKLPTCQSITCSAPPNITNGMHNGNHLESFDYNTSVTYKCDPNFSLTGEASIHCTTKDNINGVWNGSAPECKGLCGTLPRLRRAIPRDTSRTEGFPINAEVTYKCVDGCVKIPGKSDTVVCLSNSEWSSIGEFCDHDCGAPPRLKSAALSKEDERKNYHPSGSTVRYVCRPGYERTELTPVITCLENLTWSESPEFCRGKSCGVPKGPEHGRAVDVTNVLYGAKVNIICDDGFRLRGRTFIQCLWKGDQVEWSPLPTCQAITCSPPPNIANGTHNGSNMEIFHCNSLVTYKCDPNFSLTGEASIHCTTKDNINGVWNGSAPECKGLCGTLPRLRRAIPRDTSRTEGFPINAEVTYKCVDGCVKIPGKSDTVVCLSNSEWSSIGEFCDHDCGAPPRLKSAALSKEDERKNYHPSGSTVRYVCRPGYERTELTPVITCLENLTWSESPEFCRGPGIDKHMINGMGMGIGIGTGISAFSICAGIVVAYILGQKKKRSYGVNLDSRKHHITTEHDFQMSETKSNLILKV
ncbi:complement receptor type 1-like isoform X1 [Lepidochelys kempii]|uniref:complement receptor type 1-like isoform X1 n=1 Tax=Lepidochelys kempii TaxID=8472 RepID=UPI003C6F2FD5